MRAVFASLIPGLHKGLVLLLLCLVSGVQTHAQGLNVDLALVLAVDVSSSMTIEELGVQRAGYVAAIADPEVAEALRAGYFHRIALSYVEWADPHQQVVTMPWRIIDGPIAAQAFAAELATQPLTSGTNTAISSGLLFAEKMFLNPPFQTDRRVIDVSGDGPNTAGPHVAPVCDRIVANWIVINGLPVVVGKSELAPGSTVTLESYYRDCVSGGPGAFVLPVTQADGMLSGIRRKLVLEIAGTEPQLITASVIVPPKVDCTTGQKDFYE